MTNPIMQRSWQTPRLYKLHLMLCNLLRISVLGIPNGFRHEKRCGVIHDGSSPTETLIEHFRTYYAVFLCYTHYLPNIFNIFSLCSNSIDNMSGFLLLKKLSITDYDYNQINLTNLFHRSNQTNKRLNFNSIFRHFLLVH